MWYVLHIRRRFIPVAVRKLQQMNVEIIVRTNPRKQIFAKLLPQQRTSVALIVGVMGMCECTAELVMQQNSSQVEAQNVSSDWMLTA